MLHGLVALACGRDDKLCRLCGCASATLLPHDDSTWMSASDPKATTIGFVTVCEHAELGLVGGYLALNALGRPLEFHCTAPVKPTRAQEILYGPTLRPYLRGEQIAATLITKARGRPACVFTDDEFVAAARLQVEEPLALLLADAAEIPNPALWQGFALGDGRAAVMKRFADDERRVLDAARMFAETLDLREPFGRIREALEEAQKSARPAA
jgi:hypothetical protein